VGDFSESRFSDADLAILLQRCPALTELTFTQGAVTKEGLLRIAQLRPASLQRILLIETNLDRDEEEDFKALMAKLCPGMEVQFPVRAPAF
jgi:hypothetical protein